MRTPLVLLDVQQRLIRNLTLFRPKGGGARTRGGPSLFRNFTWGSSKASSSAFRSLTDSVSGAATYVTETVQQYTGAAKEDNTFVYSIRPSASRVDC